MISISRMIFPINGLYLTKRRVMVVDMQGTKI